MERQTEKNDKEMRKERIDFKGMVRVTPNANAQASALEEVINMRYEGGGLKVLGRKVAVVSNTAFKKVILHKIGSIENYIAFYGGKVCHVNIITLGSLQDIYTATGDVELSVLNNMLVINDIEAEKLVTYEFSEGSYNLLFNGLPALPTMAITLEDYSNPSNSLNWISTVGATNADVSGGLEKFVLGQVFSTDMDDYGLTEETFRDTVISAIKQTKTSIDGYNEGHILVSLNYTLLNGEETKMSNPILINLGRYEAKPFIYFGTYNARMMLALQKAVVTLSNTPAYATYKGLIKAINIYATLPLSRYELEKDKVPKFFNDGNTFIVWKVDNTFVGFAEKDYKNEDFANLLFFKQYSIPLNNIEASYTLKFGFDQSEEKTLPVENSGWLKTSGKMFVYNNRLHLFDYKRQFIYEEGIFTKLNYARVIAAPQEAKTINVSFLLQVGTRNLAVNGQVDAMIERLPDNKVKLWLSEIVAFPDSRAMEMYISFELADTIIPTNTLVYQSKVVLTPSKTYNYAYIYKTFSLTEPLLLCSVVGIGEGEVIPSSNVIEDKDVILVSSQGMPFHFPVEHSYRIGGEIQDLALLVEQISEAQQGQFPLAILTDRGIFALQQGNGVVLYSNLVPISNDVCKRGAVQTKSGVVYIANGAINLLVGREGINLSFPLEKEPQTDIRSNNSFILATKNIALYDISAYLSQVDFRDYLSDAVLLSDSNKEEVIVSNKTYSYSYLYSLRSKLWSKITGSFTQGSGRLALRTTQSGISPSMASTARLVVSELILQEAFAFIASNKCTLASGDTIIPSGITLSMFANNLQVSSLLTQTAMPLYLCIEEMVAEMPSMEMIYNPTTKVIDLYTNDATLNAKTIEVKNILTSIASGLLGIYAQSVQIVRKGIAETISATINGIVVSATINVGETYLSLANRLATAIGTAIVAVTADAVGNSILITSKSKGATMNNYTIAVTSSMNCLLTCNPFEGAKDETAIASDSFVDVVDLTTEELNGIVLTHVQTRPMILNNEGYKAIYRAILRGELNPNTKPFGCYIFASNHLKGWEMVSASQTSTDKAYLRLLRTKKAYKYYIIVFGGIVDMNHNITSMDFDIQEQLEQKER